MQIQRLRVEGGRTYLGRPAIGLGIKTEEREIAPDPVTGVSRGRSAKVPRIQLHEPQAAEEAPGAESGGAVQGASSRTHKPDAGYQPRPYGPGPRGISPRMDRIFRAMGNTGSARQAGAMAPAPTSVDGLEPVETRNHEISRTPPARHRCAGRRANGG